MKFNLNFKSVCTASLLAWFLCLSLRAHSQAAGEIRLLREWVPASVVSDEVALCYSLDSCFTATPISNTVFARMQGNSYKKDCPVPRASLRYLKVLHRNAEGKTQLGEIVCNASIADDLTAIFRKLYEAGYKIERITLIDNYDADDERSMSANNTSCFNFRKVSGTTHLSKHAKGLAIDINPLYNPYIRLNNGKVEPVTGKPYATNRTAQRNTKVPLIDKNDLCYRLFVQHGFLWGGNWRTVKDYQHFEK